MQPQPQPMFRPEVPFHSRRDVLREMGRIVRESPPLPPRETGDSKDFCSDPTGRDILASPEEIEAARCGDCKKLSMLAARRAIDAGAQRVDLCMTVSKSPKEHVFLRVDGVRRDPAVEGGMPPRKINDFVAVTIWPPEEGVSESTAEADTMYYNASNTAGGPPQQLALYAITFPTAFPVLQLARIATTGAEAQQWTNYYLQTPQTLVREYMFDPRKISPPDRVSLNRPLMGIQMTLLGNTDNMSGFNSSKSASGPEGGLTNEESSADDAFPVHLFYDNEGVVHQGTLVAGQGFERDSMTWPVGVRTVDSTSGHEYAIARPESSEVNAIWVAVTGPGADARAQRGQTRNAPGGSDPRQGSRGAPQGSSRAAPLSMDERLEAYSRQTPARQRPQGHNTREGDRHRAMELERQRARTPRATSKRPRAQHEVQALAEQTLAPAFTSAGDNTWELQIVGGQAFKVGSDGTRFDLGQWLGNNRVLFNGSYYEVDSHGNAVLLGSADDDFPQESYYEPAPPPPVYYAPPPPMPPPYYGGPPVGPRSDSNEMAAWIGQAVYEGTIGANQAFAQQQQNLAVGPIAFQQGDPFYNELFFG